MTEKNNVNKKNMNYNIEKILDAIEDEKLPIMNQHEKIDYIVNPLNVSVFKGYDQLVLQTNNAMNNLQCLSYMPLEDFYSRQGSLNMNLKKVSQIVAKGINKDENYNLDVVVPVEVTLRKNNNELKSKIITGFGKLPRYETQLANVVNKQEPLKTTKTIKELDSNDIKSVSNRLEIDLENYFICMFSKEKYEPKTNWKSPIWKEALMRYAIESPEEFIQKTNISYDAISENILEVYFKENKKNKKIENKKTIETTDDYSYFNELEDYHPATLQELNTEKTSQDFYNKYFVKSTQNYVNQFLPEVNIEEAKIFIPQEYGMEGDKNKLHVLLSFNSLEVSDDTLFDELNEKLQPFTNFEIDWFPIDTKDVGSINDFLEIKKEQNKVEQEKTFEANEYKERIHDELIDFFANLNTNLSDKAKEIASTYQQEWDNLPCDPEGASYEQNKAMEKLLYEASDEIMDLEKVWNQDFIFIYNKKSFDSIINDGFGHEGYDLQGRFVEYDKTVIDAPDKIFACKTFINMSGAFGLPDIDDYTVYSMDEYKKVQELKSKEQNQKVTKTKPIERNTKIRKRDDYSRSR